MAFLVLSERLYGCHVTPMVRLGPKRMGVDMDYHEACEAIVSRQEARLELEAHGALFHEFALARGDKQQYYGYEVLNYLGY